MEIYSLTARGQALAHSIRSPNTPEWAVIFFLKKQGRATAEQIRSYIPSVTASTLAKLRIRGIIHDETGVNV
jgi:hypothetical protein